MSNASGEIRALIVVVTFLSSFFILSFAIPSGFFVSPYEGKKEINVPEYFEAIDIYSYAETYNFTITNSSVFEKYFTLGNWNVLFNSYYDVEKMKGSIYDSWWLFKWNFRSLKWYNKQGVQVSYDYYSQYINHDILDANYDSSKQECKFTLSNSDVTFHVYFGFNQTAYSKPSDALAQNDLECLFCINFDEVNTSFNAWNLIGSILFFQMPNVHVAINMLIAIPIWLLIAYLVYVLILKAIPFVGS
ncbi:MAG: hypothetical protein OEY47_01340 [Candidatus Bathyarchaeota archaeon]|nr:hypothetical protein [Candidatus Bathyarchaeota archaeon]